MTAPVFVAAGADAQIVAAGAASPIPVPAGVSAGDRMFLVAQLANGAGNALTAAGWTPVISIAATNFQTGLTIVERIATASEPSTYNVSQGAGVGNTGRAKIYAYSGVHATTPVNVSASTSAQSGVTTVNGASLATTVADTRVLMIGYEYNGRTPTLTPGGAQTSRGGSTTAGLVFLLSDEAIAATGAVPARTQSSSLSGDFFAVGIALAPSSAGDTTPPTIAGPGGSTGATSSISVAENGATVHTFTANESVTWSLNGGADAAKFTINSSTGALAFATPPNYEAPTDADTNNVYVVVVRATDAATNATDQTVSVTVTDVAEGGSGSITFDGFAVAGTLWPVGTVVNWQWSQRSAPAVTPTSVTYGNFTLTAAGSVTISGVPIAAGDAIIVWPQSTRATDRVGYAQGTPA